MNRLLIVLTLVALIAGCASAPKEVAGNDAKKAPAAAQSSADQVVSERAKARWEAIVAADYEKAYAFLSEGYRDVTPLDAYRLKRLQDPFKIKAAYVSKVTCADAETCNASVTLTVETLMPNVGTQSFYDTQEEPWFKQGDNWYHVPKK